MKIISVVGARPNFMKISPFIRAIQQYNDNNAVKIIHKLLHTGQHYDDCMSKTFFKELNIPEADINLGIGSGTHAEQVGQTMIAFEKILNIEKPDWVVLVGDVNATLACSITAKKEGVKVCHIEAGLRSGDMTMPEEINRLVTDRIADLLLTPDFISSDNLLKEGIEKNKIVFTGNIMIDTLEASIKIASKLHIKNIILKNILAKHTKSISIPADNNFALMTLHRPSNVDSEDILTPIIRLMMDEITDKLMIVWPVHPRTQKQLKLFNLYDELNTHKNIILLNPLGYFDMLRLNMSAKITFTDSGGLQEECTVLGTPCLTLRYNTERPITLREHGGASVLVGSNIDMIRESFYAALKLKQSPIRPELWDGKTAERCLKAILEYNI